MKQQDVLLHHTCIYHARKEGEEASTEEEERLREGEVDRRWEGTCPSAGARRRCVTTTKRPSRHAGVASSRSRTTRQTNMQPTPAPVSRMCALEIGVLGFVPFFGRMDGYTLTAWEREHGYVLRFVNSHVPETSMFSLAHENMAIKGYIPIVSNRIIRQAGYCFFFSFN